MKGLIHKIHQASYHKDWLGVLTYFTYILKNISCSLWFSESSDKC